MNQDIGVTDPDVRAFCVALQRLIEDFPELSHAGVTASLDLVKLEYQLRLFAVVPPEDE